MDQIRWDGILTWDVDSGYTQAGLNRRVQKKTIRDEFNTLRIFPNKTQDNCYIVPAETESIRYIIRAGFYYGNYDGLSRPPTFNLFINDVIWTTINTAENNGDPFYKEIVYESNGSGALRICLLQIIGGGDEMYNRIWSKGLTPSTCSSVIGYTDVNSRFENYPPYLVLMSSIESSSLDSIFLTVELPEHQQSAYFVFYITELDYKSQSETRFINIQIDGQDQGTVEAPSAGESMVITMYPVIVSGPILSIILTRGEGSTLPPVLAAMEVFTKFDPNVNYTTQSSAPAGEYISFAYLLIISFIFLFVV
ncbi:hypothetical protein DCAR_0415549 [Daucus carota subsp. sativus]|uniref:Malectin-like domain-containing protein n=1 Tax=Daucus carota subsp. sativus TaxID=79200 RepID=A0AAF0WWJ2_DAUCS|nr:hypothetical protein DCAR_0415549 [Daucus carota subsp. sativus]